MRLRSVAYVAFLAPVACGTTPLDSVVAERVTGAAGGGNGGSSLAGGGAGGGGIGGGGSAGAGGSDGGAGSPQCTQSGATPGKGRFLLRERAAERCIQKGMPDTVFGAPVFHALFDAECESLDAQWDLIELGGGLFALNNVGVGDNLDVRAGAPTDGTPLVLYEAHPATNQWFAFAPRAAPYYALEPQNSTAKCVEVVGSAAQVFPCDPSNQAQEFTLERLDCPP